MADNIPTAKFFVAPSCENLEKMNKELSSENNLLKNKMMEIERELNKLKEEELNVTNLKSKLSYYDSEVENYKRKNDELNEVVNFSQDYGADRIILDLKGNIDFEYILKLKKLNIPIISLDNNSEGVFFADVNIFPVAHFVPDEKWELGELIYEETFELRLIHDIKTD